MQRVIVNIPRSNAKKSLWEQTIDVGVRLAAVAATLYGLGFFVRAATFSVVWQIYDPEPFRNVSIETGLWFVIFCCVAVFPIWLYRRMPQPYKNTQKSTSIRVLLSFVVAVMLTIGLIFRWSQCSPNLTRDIYLRLTITMAFAFSLGYAILNCWDRVAVPNGPDRVLYRIGLIVCSLFLVFPFAAAFIVIPQPLGGGQPIKREVWFSEDASSILYDHHLIDSNQKPEKLVKVSNLWVLYERGKVFVFCNDGACSQRFQVPGEWVKSEVWDAPAMLIPRKQK
jgi:hypothetical protein